MNYIGTFSRETHLKGDVFDLYDKAVQQAPEGELPFLIFIDANVPDSPEKGLPSYSDIPVDTVSWMKEIRDRLLEIWNAATEPIPESTVFITNLAYYYGDNDKPSPGGRGSFFPSTKPRRLHGGRSASVAKEKSLSDARRLGLCQPDHEGRTTLPAGQPHEAVHQACRKEGWHRQEHRLAHLRHAAEGQRGGCEDGTGAFTAREQQDHTGCLHAGSGFQ